MRQMLRHFLQYLYKVAFTLVGKILPQNENLIVFESFLGKQYSDNPRAIYEYLKQHDPTKKMYWSVVKPKKQEYSNLKCVRRFSIRWMFIMNRAGYWITNSRMPLWIPKPNGTTYVQTWHGTPLKRLATDMEEVHMPDTDTEKYKRNFVYEASKWDYLISPNEYSSKIFRRAFQFKQKIIESGYPRNDYLVNCNNEHRILEIKKQLGLPLNKKIILYAPTWRDNQFYERGKYKFDLELDLDLLNQEIGNDYIVLLRLHYLVAENLDLTGYSNFVYDVSNYEDIRDLYLISDLLLTDYSSVFFDYAILKRPMIFYVYDIDEYKDVLRGFYFDFENKAPGPLVKHTEEIIKEIKTIDEHGFKPSIDFEQFHQKFCYLEDGHATERVVKEIFN